MKIASFLILAALLVPAPLSVSLAQPAATEKSSPCCTKRKFTACAERAIAQHMQSAIKYDRDVIADLVVANCTGEIDAAWRTTGLLDFLLMIATIAEQQEAKYKR